MTRHPDPGVLAECREGLLGRRRSARIRAHLARCAHCASVDDGLANITALLASSPAPSMPSHLIARLDSALAAEVAARPRAADAASVSDGTASRPQAVDAAPADAGDGAAGPLPGGTAPQPDGRPSSSHLDGHGWWPGRRPARSGVPARRRPAVLGAVAAAMIVLAGAGYGLASLTQQQPGGTSASSGGAGGAGTPHSDQLAPAEGPANTSTGGGLLVIHSGIDYQPGTLASQAEALGSRFGPNSGLAHGTSTPAGQTATAQQRACVMLITGGTTPRLVDVARYRGHPATIIVQAPSAGQPGQVWVARPACSAQHRDILAHTSLPSSG